MIHTTIGLAPATAAVSMFVDAATAVRIAATAAMSKTARADVRLLDIPLPLYFPSTLLCS